MFLKAVALVQAAIVFDQQLERRIQIGHFVEADFDELFPLFGQGRTEDILLFPLLGWFVAMVGLKVPVPLV